MEQTCTNCKYRKRASVMEPCATGVYQLRYSKRRYCWKQSLFSKLFRRDRR